MAEGDRTEAATAKRLQKAAEEGDLLKSRDVATALVVLAGVAWAALFGRSLLVACKGVMAAAFVFDRRDVAGFSPWRPLAEAGGRLAPSLLALFAIALVAGVVSQAGLSGLRWNGALLLPKGSRVNPAAGLGRIFGPQGWQELGKALLKVGLLGGIGYLALRRAAHQTLGLAASDLPGAMGRLGDTLTGTLFAMAAGLVAIAAIDLPIQLLRRSARLKMSKQEIKDERKEADGNPEVKAQQRARARALLGRGVRQVIAEAHVVLTNPTHFAVALRYERGKDRAPVVVAKGRGATALAIRDLAAEGAVPVLEYPALARAVYYTSREGQEVRDDLYLAIATVLAWVFNVNARAGGKAPPPVDVPAGARFDENGVATA
jgi:flagellar biosynthesis protein FlhB